MTATITDQQRAEHAVLFGAWESAEAVAQEDARRLACTVDDRDASRGEAVVDESYNRAASAYDALVEWVSANDLEGTELDPEAS